VAKDFLICLRVAVHKHGSRAGAPDCFRRGEEGVRMRDDFVARSDARRHQGQPDGIRAIADADGVFHAVERGQFLFKLLVHRPRNLLATFQYFLDVGVNRRLLFLFSPFLFL
jgi:hypothetical protein